MAFDPRFELFAGVERGAVEVAGHLIHSGEIVARTNYLIRIIFISSSLVGVV